MSVEVIDGATIRGFVEDEKVFERSVAERFASLDANGDGVLSYAEMAEELRSLRVAETELGCGGLAQTYGSLFGQFDHDGSGAVDLEEFRAETREMMLSVADGLGFLPVQMVLEEGSFLKRAADRESSKVGAQMQE